MAFCAGREDEDREFWGDGGYEDAEEDALFGSLDGDHGLEGSQDDGDDLFSVRSPVVQTAGVMTLDLVERLSWDATSDGYSDDDEQDESETPPTMKLTLPEPLPIQVGDAGERDAAGLQWSLISPCSDTGSPQASLTPVLSPLTRVSISSPVRQLRFFEPELEPSNDQVKATEEKEEEEEEEDVQPFDPETCWAPDKNSVLSVASPATSASANPFATYRPPESAVEEEEQGIDRSETVGGVISDSDSDGQSNAASALRPSLLPRVPTMARWRRQKARTCSGAGSAGMPTALSLATFRARTRSLSRSRNQSVDDEDDGDFSSDDEGYTPELHHRRASE
ncbi:hypothetical protein PHYSODRAFT_462684, partial [Phytophthora sojae]